MGETGDFFDTAKIVKPEPPTLSGTVRDISIRLERLIKALETGGIIETRYGWILSKGCKEKGDAIPEYFRKVAEQLENIRLDSPSFVSDLMDSNVARFRRLLLEAEDCARVIAMPYDSKRGE